MKEETKIDLSAFSSGLYYLRAISEDGYSSDIRLSVERWESDTGQFASGIVSKSQVRTTRIFEQNLPALFHRENVHL